jgi:hypothetical protein
MENKRRRGPSILAFLALPLSVFALLTTSCGTLEIGFELNTPLPTASAPVETVDDVPTVPLNTPTVTPFPAASAPAEAVDDVPTVALNTPTATPLSPTPTQTPAPVATISPTEPPQPAAERIRFAPGAIQTTVEGYLPTSDTKVYVMHVAAGQYVAMDATVGTMGQGLRFSIVGADGTVVKAMGEAHIRTVVPSTQDYYVELVSDVGAVNYQMSVLIPIRIRFAPGDTSAVVEGSLTAGDSRHYVLHALAGQRMIVDPRATQGQVRLIISGADGQVLLSGNAGRPGGVYDGILPTTQDYLITVQAEGGTGADYVLEITIPPL